MTKKSNKQSETIELARESVVVAYKRAESMGLSLSEYVQSLISKDAQVEVRDPWREPVPQHVSERWEREIAETKEEEKQSGTPRKTYLSAEEYVADMKE